MVSNGTGLATDYTVTLTNGTLTVNPYAFSYTIGNDSQTYGTRGQPGGRPAATIITGVNGENLAIAYSSTGDTSTAHVGHLRHHRHGVQRHGPGQRLHRDP